MQAEKMAPTQHEDHWLDRYATDYYKWRTDASKVNGGFSRPLGLVENFFSCDGADHGGRADMFFGMTLQCKHALSEQELVRRVVLAWTSLRLQHVLLMAKVNEVGPQKHRWFVVAQSRSAQSAIQAAEESISQVERHEKPIAMDEFQVHCSNTGRIIDASKCLSKLFILPPDHLGDGNTSLALVMINSHEISDGMAPYNWMSHFIRLLNTSEEKLLESIDDHCSRSSLQARLPIAQEDLYLKIPGNWARQRWFWAIARILRHMRRPLPAGFENPLYKSEPLHIKLQPVYADVLDYSEERRPTLSSNHLQIKLSPATTRNIAEIARGTGGTLGAAIFALVALVMMEIEEEKHPGILPEHRKPMVMSFPISPKPYFNLTSPSDSCMLAFGDNFHLPFLSSDLDRTGRFKLLLRQCQTKLSKYQKRIRNPSGKLSLAAYSPTRLLATGYIFQLDRGWRMLRPNGLHRAPFDPQSSVYPASRDANMATNGVSNVGSLRHFFDDKARFVPEKNRAQDLEVDYVTSLTGVRAREGEFLVGSKTLDDSLIFSVSYDATIMDEALVQKWKQRMETSLEPEVVAA